MEERYNRNQIHIDEGSQELIKGCKILIAGCGIGSYIAECLLRMGFERLTIIDGDTVELSNLNRQNYDEADIDDNKAVALFKRLQAINSQAAIEVIPHYLTADNLKRIKIDHDVAVNALDFSSDVPFYLMKFVAGEIFLLSTHIIWAGRAS
ncbi:HesA/MoeB/ThiF family protein [Niabella ginsengisoli]|uniref:ThiF family adenylyltransferase n=1 Tax=Niabella ginsengisoli TaxID=522298 RepID=A0ABS9SHX4_9BACT|nr:ThiF family adenylyltransferase [Niabella ginsengisoli]MCH5597957.1 ThiF family adenylyltransferase [Niabella ginsengisoli]